MMCCHAKSGRLSARNAFARLRTRSSCNDLSKVIDDINQERAKLTPAEYKQYMQSLNKELQVVLPDAVGSALRDGLREEAAPISRRLAEVKGLSNQMIRRFERLETDMLAERHARIDDLSLLVELITSEWRGLNERLDRIERMIEPRAEVVELRRPADAG